MLHRQRMVGALIIGALAAGCGSEATTPNGDETIDLAATFDGLSSEANGRGDGDESAAFSGAAMAVRLGIRPTEIPVTIRGDSRRYLAFVHVIRHGQRDGNRPALRTMVAYRRGEERRPLEVLYLATTADSVGLEAPGGQERGGERPFAVASWKDLVNRQFWVATAGRAGIRLESTGDACPKPRPSATVTCTVAEFGVVLDGEFHPLINNQRGQIDRTQSVGIGTRAGDVNGAVVVIN